MVRFRSKICRTSTVRSVFWAKDACGRWASTPRRARSRAPLRRSGAAKSPVGRRARWRCSGRAWCTSWPSTRRPSAPPAPCRCATATSPASPSARRARSPGSRRPRRSRGRRRRSPPPRPTPGSSCSPATRHGTYIGSSHKNRILIKKYA